MLHILTITNLYPNREQPRHGIFVEQRMKRIAQLDGVRLTVVAPIPWRPFSNNISVENYEYREGVDIYHPRFIAIPKLGMYINSLVIAFVIAWCLLVNRGVVGKVHLVDAHYFYPDGVAAAFIAKFLKLPLLITARGTDINLLPRKLIQYAIKRAAAIISVSDALKEKLLVLGAQPNKVHVIKNGVDTEIFFSRQNGVRASVVEPGEEYILSVGNLVAEKGHQYVIEAMKQLEAYKLIIIGRGKKEKELKALAEQFGVQQRVYFVPNLGQSELADYYSQASVLVLASEREGLPNVVLEALACGTPVVASGVGGVPEIIEDDKIGRMVEVGDIDGIVRSVKELKREAGDSEYIHQYAKQFSWDNTTRKMTSLIKQLNFNVE